MKKDTEFEVVVTSRKLSEAAGAALKEAVGGPAVFCQLHDHGTQVRIKGALIDADTAREIHNLLARRLSSGSSGE